MSETVIEQNETVRFADLSLSAPVQAALDAIGYETPSPIQAKAIPVVLSGRDIIGQAQTGTGKTAAFALPLLSQIDPKEKGPHALILAPTRELALQVAEAIEKYGSQIKGLSVASIYGGSDFIKQFKALDRNPAIVVGTPGRVMDHMRRGTLDLSRISHFVLDEADEMLRMGFIDDVEWILEHTPAERQTLLFSATMPPRIASIAEKQLREPVTVKIKAATATVDTVRQRFVQCAGMRQKLEVLVNLLETEERDAAIIFTRTKSSASMVADELTANGHAAEAIHGDISQGRREKAVSMLKSGQLDILVATDVAARGLDVDRISHVFNFDIPGDVEPYIHRIGRAGRAGRSGDAILLITRRDFRQLREIEAVTRSRMEPMPPPTRATIEAAKQRKLQARISETLTSGKIDRERETIRTISESLEIDIETLAATLLKMAVPSATKPIVADFAARAPREDRFSSAPGKRDSFREGREPRERSPRNSDSRERRTHVERAPRHHNDDFTPRSPDREQEPVPKDADRYRIEVGHNHRVKPGNIVGAIANEAGLEARFIGRIDIYDDHSLIDLPKGMPREILQLLKKTWIAGTQMRMSRVKLDAVR